MDPSASQHARLLNESKLKADTFYSSLRSTPSIKKPSPWTCCQEMEPTSPGAHPELPYGTFWNIPVHSSFTDCLCRCLASDFLFLESSIFLSWEKRCFLKRVLRNSWRRGNPTQDQGDH